MISLNFYIRQICLVNFGTPNNLLPESVVADALSNIELKKEDNKD